MKTTVHYVKPLSVALLTALSITFSGSVFAVAGKFQFVNGEVQVIDTAGKSRLAQKGGAIDEGETVSSAGNGFAQIKMEDGGFFAVRPDTEFKVDTFQFNGKEDGSEKGVFSLIKGSLRSVTGLIGKKHKDNYKIQTATSTIGIRGSGADVGHSNAIGTAVRTIWGGHSLTSGGKTIVTGPGQTALAPPGQAPGYVANFPFNTATAPGGNGQGDKHESNGTNGNSGQQSTEKQGPNKTDKPEPLATLDQKIVIPIKDTNGNDYTQNEDSGGGAIGGFSLPAGTNYVHFISALKAYGAGYVVAEQGADQYRYTQGNYTFDSNGILVGVASSNLEIGFADNSYFNYGPSSLAVLSGSGLDAYHTPDNSIFLGRGSNIAVNTTCSGCSGTDNFISAHFLVGVAPAPALVQTLTGTANYTLAGSTHPTDALGNVGTLNNAYVNANFTNQTVGFGVDVTIASKNLVASASNIPILDNGFDARSVGGVGNLTVTCTGACAASANGSVGGGFFGNAGASAALGYAFWPLGNNSGEFNDYVHGVAALTAGTAPSAVSSIAGTVGGGGAAVGVGTLGGSDFVFNDFNIVDNSSFAARHDTSGNLIAFTKSGMSQDISFAANHAGTFPAGGVQQDGTDPTLGVVWGRWGSGYAANVYDYMSGNASSLLPIHKLAFITGSHITSISELAALPGLGVTTATYNLAAGSFPTIFDGMSMGSITSASATVNFSTSNITAFSVGGSGGGFGTWSASGSGSIANFMSATGIALSGTCLSGSGTCAPAMVQPISGTASGGFVGTQAQGLIATVGLSASPTEHLGGAVYMKR